MKNDIRPPQRYRATQPAPVAPAPVVTPDRRRLIVPLVAVVAAAAGILTVLAWPTPSTHSPIQSRYHSPQIASGNIPATETPARAKPRSYKKLTAIPTPVPASVAPTTDPVLVSAAIIAGTPIGASASVAPASVVPNTADLTDPRKKDIAMQLVSSAENSSLDWRAQYAYIQDIGDGRGYTGGLIGFTSGTHDMLELVQYYAQLAPGNVLAKYLPALGAVDGTASHAGLGDAFVADWKLAATDPKFQAAQDHERDTVYFDPAVTQAKADGLHALGQFIYYDAIVMHGPGTDPVSFGGIRATALAHAKTPVQGGDETTYLNAFLDARKAAMLTEAAHDDTSRVDTEQRLFLSLGNLYLNPPLVWQTYGDRYTIAQ